MGKVLLRFVAVSMVAGLGVGVIGVTAGSAATDPSFAGTYAVKVEPQGSSTFGRAGSMTLSPDGSVAGGGLHRAHWSNAGKKLTILLHLQGHTIRLIAVQTKTGNLGSATHPGSEIADGSPVPLQWYAVRKR